MRSLWVAPILLATSVAWAAPGRRVLFRSADAEGPLVMFVDRDDDDADGIRDLDENDLGGEAGGDVAWIEPRGPRRFESLTGDAVRLVYRGKPVAPRALAGKTVQSVGLQGLAPGLGKLELSGLSLDIVVLDLYALDAKGRVIDAATSHASISRTLPQALSSSGERDDDALRWVVAGPHGLLPSVLHVSSFGPDARPLDTLGEIPVGAVVCPSFAQAGLDCRATPPIRATSDVIDRSHPESAAHSLMAEVGGRIVVSSGSAMLGLRVGGPRETTRGPVDRLRGRLRVRLVRNAAGGSPPVGGDTDSALAIARDEVRTAGALWGQCGIHFGFGRDLDIAVVDPPPAYLLAVGCELGTPASGGEIAFRVGSHDIRVPTRAGQSPTQVARALSAALEKSGLRPSTSPNALIAPGALRTLDVVVRRPDGALASIQPLGPALSTDPTLGVCLGEVDLADGLDHFSDFDAVSGTLEERALIKAFEDGDPRVIQVFVVPTFTGLGRIGESFIYADGGSLRNTVIIDRMGIRAGARSYALAHELGHILLDMPGHPDDFGIDQPSLLMDADAADPTIFGPRRLPIADCERALRQSGPGAPVLLLEPWPLIHRK